MFIDSHCHLSFPELRENLPAVLAAMTAAQVHQAICICTPMEEFDAVLGLATAHAPLWATVGVHPDTEDMREPDVAELVCLADHPRVVTIGETGLDYYRLNGRSVADMEWQRERFRTHIRAARQARKPLVIHTRSSAADTLRVLDEEGGHEAGGVFHCFTESLEVARAALDLGFYISFSGILTFRNASDLREVAAWVPANRLLIETDSPFLAPVPHRGKQNQPALVAVVGTAIAKLRNVSAEDLAALTSRNALSAFPRIAAP
mgnify:CR=1 FL=1